MINRSICKSSEWPPTYCGPLKNYITGETSFRSMHHCTAVKLSESALKYSLLSKYKYKYKNKKTNTCKYKHKYKKKIYITGKTSFRSSSSSSETVWECSGRNSAIMSVTLRSGLSVSALSAFTSSSASAPASNRVAEVARPRDRRSPLAQEPLR